MQAKQFNLKDAKQLVIEHGSIINHQYLDVNGDGLSELLLMFEDSFQQLYCFDAEVSFQAVGAALGINLGGSNEE